LGEPRPRADPRGWTDRAEPSPRPAPPLDRQLTRHHEHDSTARSPEVPSITAGAKRPHARAEPPLRAHLRGMSPLAPRARCEGFRGDPRLAGSPCAVKTVLVSTPKRGLGGWWKATLLVAGLSTMVGCAGRNASRGHGGYDPAYPEAAPRTVIAEPGTYDDVYVQHVVEQPADDGVMGYETLSDGTPVTVVTYVHT